MLKTQKNRRKPARSGPMAVRIRFYPPTIPEAVAAARDLADNLDDQAEIAAGLMGFGEAGKLELVREEVTRMDEEAKRASAREKSGEQMVLRGRKGSARTVTVEHAGRPKVMRSGRPARAVVVERTGRFAGAPAGGRLSQPTGKVRTFDLTRRGQN